MVKFGKVVKDGRKLLGESIGAENVLTFVPKFTDVMDGMFEVTVNGDLDAVIKKFEKIKGVQYAHKPKMPTLAEKVQELCEKHKTFI